MTGAGAACGGRYHACASVDTVFARTARRGKTFARAGAEQTLDLYNFSVTALLFPSARSGFFLTGGVGLAYADTELRDGAGTSTLSDSGFGAIAGLGYDIPLGRRLAVTPAVSYMFGVTADSIKHDVFAATIALTLR